MAKYGANFREFFYPLNGHNTWYNFWGEADFWPFVNNAYSSNPWMIGGVANKHWWPGAPINETIGITAGFTGYEWRVNGNIIPGATGNTLPVTAPGLYDARVQRDGIWSDWSHVPVNVRTGFYEAEEYIDSNGVQKETTTDDGGGQDVGYIDNGDWMDYSINVYATGTYTLRLRVASTVPGGKIEIRNSDSVVLATVTVPETGGWQTWTTTEPVLVNLPAGTQNIRLKAVTNSPWNINWFQFGLATSESPLPVKFEYFNAQCRDGAVNLQWKTAQEQNSSRFSVQRSTDGLSWSEIGTLAAAGQSTQDRSYVFADKMPSSNGMYRVVEYDINGKTIISSIVRSSCAARSGISLYPNPSLGNSVLNISLEQSTTVTLQVLDSKGALIQQKQMLLPSGNSTVPLEMNNYPEGVYTINVHLNNEVKTIKMIKR
jgi:hypothetical protein